jgi:hypothetical protein
LSAMRPPSRSGARRVRRVSVRDRAPAVVLVGGHPMLLRKLGSAIHTSDVNRSMLKDVSAATVQQVYARTKRDFYNHVNWILDHLRDVAPDENQLLRDLATGGARSHVDDWKDDEFRDTFAHHLQKYGLVRFEDDQPVVQLALIAEALRKPVACEFEEQKRQLKGLVEAIEEAVRARLAADICRDRTPAEATRAVVTAIPSEAKNRSLDRQALLDLGEYYGVAALFESLNWGDYEILLRKFYGQIAVDRQRHER